MRLSGSKLGLASSCTFWAREDVPLPPRETSFAADAGTNKHSAMEALVQSLKTGTAKIDVDQFASLWGCDTRDSVQIQRTIMSWLAPMVETGKVYTEIPLAYDTHTDNARKISSSGQRDYSNVAAYEIPLTLDLAILCEGGGGFVCDHKTGRQDGLPPSSEFGQLSIGALALARCFGLDRVKVAYAVLSDDGHARIDEHVLDAFDLEAVAEEVASIVKRIPTARPNPGPWCRSKWCPLRASCPSTTSMVKATPSLSPLAIRIDSATTAAKVHSQIDAAEEFIKSVKASLKDFVTNNGPVDLADGSTLEIVSKCRETLDVDGNDKAQAVIRDTLGYAADRALSLKVTTSKEALKAATAMLAKGKERTALERRIMEELQNCKAVKVSSFETLENVKKKRGSGE